MHAAGTNGDEGALRARLADAVVMTIKRLYGRGPESAKAWILDDMVFVAMEGGLTRAEETLIAQGREDEVRAFRLAFQESIAAELKAAVADVAGRRVLTYHSQIVFTPPRSFEIFILDEPVAAG